MKNKTKLYDIIEPKKEEKPNILKETYLKERDELKKKIELSHGEVQNRYIQDLVAVLNIMEDLKYITKDELKEYMETIQADDDKYSFRKFSRDVLNDTKMFKSHDAIYALIKDLIKQVGNSYMYEDEDTTYINAQKTSEIMRGFFKWVSDDCFKFYEELIDYKHIIKSTKDTLDSYCVPSSKPFVYYGTSDKTIYQLDVYAHEFGHAYAEHLCRNNSFITRSSQFTEFYSIFFEMLFNEYLDEQHLYVEERKKMKRNDLYGRLMELYDGFLVEDLIEKGYVNERLGFSLKNPLTTEETINAFATGTIPTKEELFKQRKQDKLERKTVKEKSIHEERLLKLLMKLKDNFDYSKFNYECDNKEEIVNLRLKSIVELLGEGNIDNALDILNSLLPMVGNKQLLREFYQEYYRYYLDVDFLNLLTKELFGIDNIKEDEMYQTLIIAYINLIYDINDNLSDVNEILFNDILTEKSKDSIIPAYLNKLINEDSRELINQIFGEYAINIHAQDISENSNKLVDVLNNFIKYAYNNSNDDLDKLINIFGDILPVDLYNKYLNTNKTLNSFSELVFETIANLINEDDNNSIILLQNYYRLVFDNNNSIEDICNYVFDDKDNVNAYILGFANFLKQTLRESFDDEINKYFKDIYTDISHNLYASILNQMPDYFENIINGLITVSQDRKLSLFKRDLLKKYIDLKYTGESKDYIDVKDGIEAFISADDYSDLEECLKTILYRFTKDTDLIDEIILELYYLYDDFYKDAVKEKKCEILDEFKCDLGESIFRYNVHSYILGRTFASYFIDKVKENHEEGMKMSIDFITSADHYKASELLEKYPTVMYHVREHIARTLFPLDEELNATTIPFVTGNTDEEIVRNFMDKMAKRRYNKYLRHVVKELDLNKADPEIVKIFFNNDESFKEFKSSHIKHKVKELNKEEE